MKPSSFDPSTMILHTICLITLITTTTSFQWTQLPTNTSTIQGDMVSFSCYFHTNDPPTLLWMFTQSSPYLTYPQKTNQHQPNLPHQQLNPYQPTYSQSLHHEPPPTPQVLFIGETPFKASSKMRVEEKRVIGVVVGSRLVVEAVEVGDDGWYSCSVGHQSEDQSAFLDVIVPPGKVSITTETHDIAEGETIWLNCSCSGGNPLPLLEWKRNGEVLGEGWVGEKGNGNKLMRNGGNAGGEERSKSVVRRQMLSSDGRKFGQVSNHLLYQLSYRDHISNFTCTATQATLKTTPSIQPNSQPSQATKRLLVKFSAIITTGPHNTINVLEHSNFLLNCSVLSYPITPSQHVIWYHREAIIGSGFNLDVRNISRLDGGHYGCEVGSRRVQVEVKVQYPPRISVNITLQQNHIHKNLFKIQQGNSNNNNPNNFNNNNNPNNFNNNNNNPNNFNNNNPNNFNTNNNNDGEVVVVTAVSGQSLSIDCQCDSEPSVRPSDIVWRTEPQYQGKDLSQDQETKGSRLFLRPLSSTDQGRYTCLCSNYIQPYNLSPFKAHARKEVSLNVLYKPGRADIKLPNIALIGTRSVLKCSSGLKGNPPCKYVWKKGGVEVGKRSTLIFHNTLLSHSGLYTCLPSNLIGNGSHSTVPFTVFEPPSSLDPPTNSSQQLEVSADQLSAVVLSCSVRGKPPPKISWLRNNHLLVPDGDEDEENNNNTNNNQKVNDNLDDDLDHFDDINNDDDDDNNDNNKITDDNGCDNGCANNFYSFSSFSRSLDEFSYNVTSVLTIKGQRSAEDGLWRLGVRNAGNYTCVASNVVAPVKNMKTVRVVVKFPPEVTSKATQALEVGAEGSIHFTIHSYPPPTVQWFNGSTPLEDNNVLELKKGLESTKMSRDELDKTQSEKTALVTNRSSRSCQTELTLTRPNTYLASLRINEVSLDDLRTFTIRVYNGVGEISSAVDVVAAESPEPPFNLSTTFVSWDRVGVEWRGGGDGGLKQQFVVEAVVVEGGKKRQMVVTNTTSVCFEGLKSSVEYSMGVYGENQVGRSEPSNIILVTLKDLKLNSPSSVHYSEKDQSITINLPPTLHNLTPSIHTDHDDPLTRKMDSRDWGEFCARVDVYDGAQWRVKYPCVREVKVKLGGGKVRMEGKQVKVNEVRVSICSERRPDICSEEKYSHSGIVSAETMIAVGSVCGLVVGVLVLVVLCLVGRRVKRKRKHIKAKVTVQSENIKETNSNFWDDNQYTKTTYNIDDSPGANGWLNNNNDHINTNNNNNNINNNSKNNINSNYSNNTNNNKNNMSSSNKLNSNYTPNSNIYNNNIDLLINSNNISNNNLFNPNNNSILHLNNNHNLNSHNKNSHNNNHSTTPTTATFHGHTFTATPDLNHSCHCLHHPQPHHPHHSHDNHLLQPHLRNSHQLLPNQQLSLSTFDVPQNPHFHSTHLSNLPPNLTPNHPLFPVFSPNHPNYPLSSPTLDLTPNFSPYISEDEHNSTMQLMHSPSSNRGNTFKNGVLEKKKIIHEVVV